MLYLSWRASGQDSRAYSGDFNYLDGFAVPRVPRSIRPEIGNLLPIIRKALGDVDRNGISFPAKGGCGAYPSGFSSQRKKTAAAS